MKSRYCRITKLINKEGRRYLISHNWRYPLNENKYTYPPLHDVIVFSTITTQFNSYRGRLRLILKNNLFGLYSGNYCDGTQKAIFE